MLAFVHYVHVQLHVSLQDAQFLGEHFLELFLRFFQVFDLTTTDTFEITS